jgi:hypothetical protein
MGRPLKIAKAQAVLTITDTATTGSIVTISGGNLTTAPTVGITSGMSFVVASSISGLAANTIYYVDTILSNTTFSVSATQLSVQPRVMASLSNSSGGTVKASFNVVDAYFNNPVTSGGGFPVASANTYGVVGGNTAIVGNQVLAQVAIGINGNGTIYASTGSALVFGDANTNFDTNFVAGTAIQAGTPNINGTSTNYATVGFVSSTGNVDVTVANTVVSGNIIGVSSSDATNLTVNKPVQFIANIGTLVTGTTYFVKNIANADAFTVSTSIGGPEVQMTANTSATTARQQVTYLAGPASLVNATGSTYIYSTQEPGFIVRQKGKQKYLVTGNTSGLTAQCYTANLANAALTPNTMNIVSTNAAAGNVYVQSLNDYNSWLFTANSSPVATANIVSPGQPTGNLGYIDATPVIATFNSANAADSNVANAQPYPIVIINSL